MTIWRNGMKAVCVDNSTSFFCPELIVGDVYIVEAVLPEVEYIDGSKCCGLVLNGVRRYSVFNDDFASWRFRPAVSRKTDISIFKQILNNPHIDIEDTVDA